MDAPAPALGLSGTGMSARRSGKARRRTDLLGLAFVLLFALGCFSTRPPAATGEGGGVSGPPLGEFTVTSPGGARGTVTPTACLAGDRELFLGADLVDERSGLVVRLVVDPLEGPILRVFDRAAPFERTVLLFREECESFELSFDETGWEINEIPVRRLELAIDCASEEGAAIAGRATAEHCN